MQGSGGNPGNITTSILCMNSISLYDIPYIFNHSSIGIHLGCFHFWLL